MVRQFHGRVREELGNGERRKRKTSRQEWGGYTGVGDVGGR